MEDPHEEQVGSVIPGERLGEGKDRLREARAIEGDQDPLHVTPPAA
jgi:hypothetical protein